MHPGDIQPALAVGYIPELVARGLYYPENCLIFSVKGKVLEF